MGVSQAASGRLTSRASTQCVQLTARSRTPDRESLAGATAPGQHHARSTSASGTAPRPGVDALGRVVAAQPPAGRPRRRPALARPLDRSVPSAKRASTTSPGRTRPPYRTSSRSPARSVGSIDPPRTGPARRRRTHPGRASVGLRHASSVAARLTTDPPRLREDRACSRDCSPPPSRSRPTATCPAVSTTPPRPASRPSRSRPSSARSPTTTTPTSAPAPILIKEQRSELVKHHLWVLWTDYFKPPHFEKYPQLHQLFNEATKLAGASAPRARSTPAGRRAARQDRRDRRDLLGDQAGLT